MEIIKQAIVEANKMAIDAVIYVNNTLSNNNEKALKINYHYDKNGEISVSIATLPGTVSEEISKKLTDSIREMSKLKVYPVFRIVDGKIFIVSVDISCYKCDPIKEDIDKLKSCIALGGKIEVSS